MKPFIYLDYNATTPIDPEVSQAMKPFLDQYFGNPSSHYGIGFESRKAVETARRSVAALIGALPEEIIFTSGGSESDNHALKGIAFAHRQKGNHIIVSSIEHPAVIKVCEWLEKQGFIISHLPVDREGKVNPESLEMAITPSTILVSVMHANNEVGTIQPISQLSAIAHKHGILFHADAAQSAGKIHVNVDDLGVDLLTLAAHKIYGPKGIGALYIRKGTVIEQLIHGASQERNLRSGTENLLEIAGFGKAAEIALRDLNDHAEHMLKMRNLLAEKLLAGISTLHINGNPAISLPNTLSVAFAGMQADAMISSMPGIAVSAGAACHADDVAVSHVLEAMHVDSELAMGTVRFSTGCYTTEEEIIKAAQMVTEAFNSLNNNVLENKSKLESAQVQLTQFSHGLGCGCKLRPAQLEAVLQNLPSVFDPDLLVGNNTADDAAVYRIDNQKAIVQTVDFFTPIVDDPYDFGSIAAANSISDIYAMGAKPIFALNIVAFPAKRLPVSVLNDILRGASDKAAEAGIIIAGGHSIDDNEPKFGMCVTGIVNPNGIWRNVGAKPGDVLILTKPLGTGILSAAMKKGIAGKQSAAEAIDWMKQLNKEASAVFREFNVHACTDITGFGLPGHLSEMTRGSKVDAELIFSEIPFMRNVREMVMAGAVSGGTRDNLSFFGKWLRFDQRLSEIDKLMLADAQTSGGLLVAIPEIEAQPVLAKLKDNGIAVAGLIGRIVAEGEGIISVK